MIVKLSRPFRDFLLPSQATILCELMLSICMQFCISSDCWLISVTFVLLFVYSTGIKSKLPGNLCSLVRDTFATCLILISPKERKIKISGIQGRFLHFPQESMKLHSHRSFFSYNVLPCYGWTKAVRSCSSGRLFPDRHASPFRTIFHSTVPAGQDSPCNNHTSVNTSKTRQL